MLTTELTFLNSGFMDASGLAKITITLPETNSNGVYIFVSTYIFELFTSHSNQ